VGEAPAVDIHGSNPSKWAGGKNSKLRKE
jgi:hypothetical protein